MTAQPSEPSRSPEPAEASGEANVRQLVGVPSRNIATRLAQVRAALSGALVFDPVTDAYVLPTSLDIAAQERDGDVRAAFTPNEPPDPAPAPAEPATWPVVQAEYDEETGRVAIHTLGRAAEPDPQGPLALGMAFMREQAKHYAFRARLTSLLSKDASWETDASGERALAASLRACLAAIGERDAP